MAWPKRWAETTIGQICSFTNGKAFKPSDWSDEGLPIIRIQNLNNPNAPFNHYDGIVESRFEVVPGDLLFAWSGTPGSSFGAHIWRGPKAVLNQHIFKLEFDRTVIDPEYLCYAINETLDEQEANARGGVGLRHVTRESFSNTKVPLPPFKEQVRLARLLTGFRSRSGAIRSALGKVGRLADVARQSVLASAFEGDLTRAWRAERPELESVPRLLARVPPPEQTLRGREASTRVLPGRAGISVNNPEIALPEGWSWVSLLRVARQETGHTPSRRNPEYWGGAIPWVGIRDASAHHGGHIADTAQKITEAGLANSSARLLPAGTVCLSRTASVGYVTILAKDMATSQDFATWTCGAALYPEYLMYALMSEGAGLRRFGEGTVHTTIYFPEIRAFHIRLAPLEEQWQIVESIREALRRIDQFVEAARAAAAQVEGLERKILRHGFSGKLTLPEPGDGSAADLLARVRPPERARAAVASKSVKSAIRRDVSMTVEKVLREAGGWLPAQEVFRRCGVGTGAETEAIELLFGELRLLDQAKKLLSEPMFDAQGRKVADRLRLAG